MNNDITFAADGNYLTILDKGEKFSQYYGNLVTFSKIKSPFSVMDTLGNDISVTIELKWTPQREGKKNREKYTLSIGKPKKRWHLWSSLQWIHARCKGSWSWCREDPFGRKIDQLLHKMLYLYQKTRFVCSAWWPG